MKRLTLIGMLLCAVSPVRACINDRDSDALALQAGRLPEAVHVITGRFERNPPRYYEMRLAHAQQQLVKQPRSWKLYDDIGASLDRLNRDSEALRWMERKRAAMPPYNPKSPVSRDAWYRYYANAGTFRAHRWLHGGARPETRREMEQAHGFILRALQINPHAHFNRERYQVLVMEWILRIRTPERTERRPLAQFLAEKLQWEDITTDLQMLRANRQTPRRTAAADGLAGLIVLGAAWESPDIFDALATALDSSEGAGLAYMGWMRCEELLNSGHRSMGGLTADASLSNRLQPQYWVGHGVIAGNRDALDKLYPQLCGEAETWARSREKFMVARFAQRRHPDWDARFWNGWKPTPPPSFDIPWYTEKAERIASVERWERRNTLVQITGALALLLATLWFVRGRLRRRRAIA